MYKVKELAEVAGISVRTLHHYDQIGLLIPDRITENGYRLYSDDNLVDLQQIMFLKEMDFPLKKIARIIEDSSSGSADELSRQREILVKKRERLDRIIETIDRAIASQKEGIKMDKNKMFTAFDMKEIEEHQKKYADEVKEKYGDSEAYKESSGKTSQYKKEDWAMIKREADEIMMSLAEKMALSPSDKDVQEIIARWQKHITERFYHCTKEILAGLGEMYVDDESFAANIDKFGKGLAVFFRDAIRIYCA